MAGLPSAADVPYTSMATPIPSPLGRELAYCFTTSGPESYVDARLPLHPSMSEVVSIILHGAQIDSPRSSCQAEVVFRASTMKRLTSSTG